MRHSKYIWTWILMDFGLALCGERITVNTLSFQDERMTREE